MVTMLGKGACFALGVLLMGALQQPYGWWLNSGRGVALTILVLLVSSVVISLLRAGPPWACARQLWGGAFVGTAAVLFWTGPGTIWPIVLVTAAAITAASVFGGALVVSWARHSSNRFWE